MCYTCIVSVASFVSISASGVVLNTEKIVIIHGHVTVMLIFSVTTLAQTLLLNGTITFEHKSLPLGIENKD